MLLYCTGTVLYIGIFTASWSNPDLGFKLSCKTQKLFPGWKITLKIVFLVLTLRI